jgi:hypothetical protein
MHWDGHFIAGTWNFDERQHRGREIKAVSEFHSEAFADFFSIVKRNIPSDAAEYYFTATLWHASSLHYLGLADYGQQYVIQHEPLAIKNLQWEVQKISIGAPDYEARAKMMGAALPAAYRDRRANRKTGRAI